MSRQARIIRPAAIGLLLMAFAFAAELSLAQTFPVRPITLLIPFPPGTGNDVVGRVIGQKMSESMGQPVLAENRIGATGSIAVEAVKSAAPDGYTLLVASSSFAINLYATRVTYELANFTPAAMVGRAPFTLNVPQSLPARSLRDFVAYAKARPAQLSAASGGNTTTGFFLTELLNKAAGLDIVVVAYKGSTLAVSDLMAGRIHLMFAPMVTSIPPYKTGKIQLLGVTGSRRNGLIPDVPTFIELGFPMLDIPSWYAFLAPAGTPRPVIARLNAEINKALANRDVNDQFANVGIEPSINSPEESDAFLKADALMWSRVVKASGIKVE